MILYAHCNFALYSLCPQMTEHYWTPQSNVSNETSTNKTFQRTISAQVHTHTHTEILYISMIWPPPVPPPPLHKHTASLVLDVYFSLLLWLTSVSLCLYQTLQDTLAYATALLNEKEQSGSSNGSDGSPANENADRSLRQVALNFNRTSCSARWASYMTHRITGACTRFTQPKREEWHKNGTSHRLLSEAVKAVCYLPRLLLAVDLKLLHSSLESCYPHNTRLSDLFGLSYEYYW